MLGRSRQQVLEAAAHMMPTVRRQQDYKYTSAQLVVSILHRPEHPAREMAPPTIMKDLPTPTSSIKIIPTGMPRGLESQGSLGSVK